MKWGESSRIIVFVDANILASRTLLDWLFHLSANIPYLALVSSDLVLDEVQRAIYSRSLGIRHASVKLRMNQVRHVLQTSIRNVPTASDFSGTDPGDAHVYSAVLEAKAEVLLTSNRSEDFTVTPDLERFEVIHPDAFFTTLHEAFKTQVTAAIRGQMEFWSGRSNSLSLSCALERAGCPDFAAIVAEVVGEG